MSINKAQREYRFHPVRKWRFDFALLNQKVAIEFEGGIFINGGHNLNSERTMTTNTKQEDKITLIPIENLVLSPLNVRKTFNQERIDGLAVDIKKNGLLQYPTVRPKDGKYEIVFGNRRYKALIIVCQVDASFKLVPCVVKEYSDEEVEAIQLAENINREELTPMEECEAYQRLLKYHKTIMRVSEVTGKTPNHIQSRIQLKSLIKEFQTHLATGVLPIAQALIVAKLPEEQQKALLKNDRVLDFNGKKVQSVCTVEELKRYIADEIYIPLNSAAFDLNSKNLNPKMGSCMVCEFNTGSNTLLFSDITDESFCTKGSCFKEKTLKHINIRVNQLKAAGEKVIPLREASYSWETGKKKVDGYDTDPSIQYNVSKKKVDGAMVGIFLQIENYNPKYAVGEEVYLSEKTKEEKISSSNSRKDQSIPAEETPLEQRERRMYKRFDKEDDLDKVEVRKLVMKEIFKQKTLTPAIVADFTEQFLTQAYSTNNLLVFREFGINPKDYAKDDGFTSVGMWDDKMFQQFAAKIKTGEDLIRFIVIAYAANHVSEHQTTDVNITDPKRDELLLAAKEYKIDIKKLHKPFVDKRKEERKLQLADLEAAKKRAKDREKKAKKESKPEQKSKAKKAAKK